MIAALAIKEKYYGKGHNELAMTLNNLGLVYSKSNQHQKAIELYRKAIEIRESIFGPDHPDVALFLFNLGVCYGKMSLVCRVGFDTNCSLKKNFFFLIIYLRSV